MSMMDSTWSGGQDHAMQPGAEDDFQQFLDMNSMANLTDGIQFDFQDFHNTNGANHMMTTQTRQTLDTPMTGTDSTDVLSRSEPASLHHAMAPMTSAMAYQSIPATMIPPPTPTEAIVDSIDAQIQFLQQQKMQHQQRHIEEQHAAFFVQQQNRIVPPTPQSLELQAGSHHYYQPQSQSDQTPQQQPLDYRYQRLKDQQEISFTPLVSPAVTPLETHFPIDAQFTVPGAYFSPLTSPALHAQNDNMVTFEHTLSIASTNSPAKMDLEGPIGSEVISNCLDTAKKPRKNATKRVKTGVRQSPISKPQRRKTATTPTMNEQVLSELVGNVELSQEKVPQLPPSAMTSTSSSTGTTTDSDHNDSVSPEALTDSIIIEMPPPPIPKPRSAKPSPYMAAQTQAAHGPVAHVLLPGIPSPATPASLMKLSSPSNRSSAGRAGSQEPIASEHIESFELPESANFPKQQTTPVEAQRLIKTPTEAKLKASNRPLTHSPLFTNPGSAVQSPQLAPGLSGTAERKTLQLPPRTSKKRASISSVHVSPALRPKISPNIKPLLPGGATAEDSASHLLATKSNYQRILEGNTVPGVSYPSELSTNLTSKRTSHKIAEQGRRNRINSALQEMATLLPRPPPKEKEKEVKEKEREDEGDGGKDKSGNIPNSKASTVELAIDYIKQLKKEVEEANRRAEDAEKKLKLGLEEKGKV